MNHNQDLPPDLKDALNSLRAVPERNRHTAALRRQNYLASIKKLPAQARPRSFNISPRLAWLAAAMALVLVMLTGTTITAVAAQGSLPGSLLYPVKTSLEDSQLALAQNSAAQFSLLETFTIRRFTEMDTLLSANTKLPPVLADRLETQFQRMTALAGTMETPGMTLALTSLQEMLQERERLMTASEGHPDDPIYAQIRQRVREMNQLVSAGLADPGQYRQQFENQNRNSSATPNPNGTPGVGPGPVGPNPSITPGDGQGPNATPTPGNGQEPVGPNPSITPGDGQGPNATSTPGNGQGSGGPNPSITPGDGQGTNATPTEKPGATPTPGDGHGFGSTPTAHPWGGKP